MRSLWSVYFFLVVESMYCVVEETEHFWKLTGAKVEM